MTRSNNNKRKKTVISTEDEDGVFDEENKHSEEQNDIMVLFEKRLAGVVADFEGKLAAKDSLLDELSTEVVNLKKKVLTLENKLDDQEAYERRDTVILSGSDVPLATDKEDSSKVVSDLIKDKVGYHLRTSEISVAHRLGPKPLNQAPDRRKFIVKICRREVKNDLLRVCRSVKPANIYVNESLTKVRSTVLYGLRQAKKKFPSIISGCGSSEGQVIAWIKPPNPQSPNARNIKTIVNTRERFCDFCARTLKCDPSDLVSDWPMQ